MCVNVKEDDVHIHTHTYNVHLKEQKKKEKTYIDTLVVAFETHWKPNDQIIEY